MNDAIKLALKHGFKTPYLKQFWQTDEGHACIAMSPQFWQALGKALGWGYNDMVDPSEHYSQEEWEDKAHQYFDLLLTGGSTEKFWKELLTPNQ